MNADAKNQDSDFAPQSNDESLIGPFIDGELPMGEARRVETLIEENEEYRTLAENFKKLDDLARTSFSEVPKVSSTQWGQVWENIQKEGPQKQPQPKRFNEWIVPFISIAALVLLGLYLGSLFFGDPEAPKSEDPPMVQKDDLEEVIPEEGEESTTVDFSG